MGKTKRRNTQDYDAKREEALLKQISSHGRKPTAPPGYFHSPKKRAANRRKERHHEKTELKHLIEEYNND